MRSISRTCRRGDRVGAFAAVHESESGFSEVTGRTDDDLPSGNGRHEVRAAFVDLSALDRLLSAPSFGPPPEVVPFRHPTFAPAISGSFTDDIPAAIAAHAQ